MADPQAPARPRAQPDQETEAQAAARRAMPPFETEPANQDNPPSPTGPSYFWLGALLLALGVVALVFPLVSTLAATVFIGGVFFVAGVLKLFSAVTARTSARRRLLKLGWSAIYILGGGLILYAPMAGAWSLTIVLAGLFIFGGVVSIGWALSKPKPAGWRWMAASGGVSILLGGLVAIALPNAAFWLPGVVAGIDLISTGAAFLVMDRVGRRALAQAEPAAR